MSKAKLDGPRKKTRVMSANKAQQREFPATHWANAVAMQRVMQVQVPSESNEPMPEDCSASDIDIIRVRGLSSQI